MEKEERSAQMLSLVEQWAESGLSQKQFAKDHQIKYHTFTYWVKRYRQRQHQNNGFIPIDLTTALSAHASTGTPRIELILDGGLVLRVY